MKRFDAILWDLDGTLLDTTEGVVSAVKYAISELKLPQLDEKSIKSFVGPPIQDSFIREYGMSKEEAQEAANMFRSAYSTKFLLQAKLYPGILEVLKTCHEIGYRMAIATYKRHDYATKISEYFGLMNYCDFIQGGDNNNLLKKSDIIDICIKEMGFSSLDRIVLIGDSEYDAVGAEQAGINFIGVTYGFGFNKTKKEILSLNFANSPIGLLDFFI